VQLAGRAGRRGEPSLVIVQAWEPLGRAVQLGARHAVEEFLDGELVRRAEHEFPPFGHLVRVVIDGPNASAVHAVARRLAGAVQAAGPELRVRGPALLHRLRGRSRRAIIVRAERATDATAVLIRLIASGPAQWRTGGVRVVLDVDPQDT
jgi:primosomal protein N' (replication factor Y)